MPIAPRLFEGRGVFIFTAPRAGSAIDFFNDLQSDFGEHHG
jgi:hypothetical protein